MVRKVARIGIDVATAELDLPLLPARLRFWRSRMPMKPTVSM